jgi:UDP-glucose 4-epimerase
MQRCLVTGGAGFIGSHLVEALVGAGHAVRVLDDFSTGHAVNLHAVSDRIELIPGNVAEPDVALAAVADCDTVFHLAALPSVVKSVEEPLLVHKACATGTLAVLDAARRRGVKRVVYAASSSAYGDQPGAERSEDDPLIPLSPYAAAKLAGEHYCTSATATYGLQTVRLRFFNVFGRRQDPKNPYSGVIALFIAAMADGRAPTIFGDGHQARDFVYVANVVQAVLKAATVPGVSGRVYNIGNGQSTTILELVGALNELLGTSLQPVFAPPRAGDVRLSQANITRARHELGYEPTVSFKDGLARTLAAYRGPKGS